MVKKLRNRNIAGGADFLNGFYPWFGIFFEHGRKGGQRNAGLLGQMIRIIAVSFHKFLDSSDTEIFVIHKSRSVQMMSCIGIHRDSSIVYAVCIVRKIQKPTKYI